MELQDQNIRIQRLPVSPEHLQDIFDSQRYSPSIILKHSFSGEVIDKVAHPQVYIYQTEQDLLFAASVEESPNCDQSLKCGEYVDGLYYKDVVEIFLCTNSSTQTYFEINLAPTGAWWAMRFVAPLERATDFTIQQQSLAKCYSEIATNSWKAVLQIPLQQFLTANDGQQQTMHTFQLGNVTAIIGRDEQNFFSQAKLPECKFHLPQYFLPITYIK